MPDTNKLSLNLLKLKMPVQMKKVKYFTFFLKSICLAALFLNPSGFAYSQNHYCGFDLMQNNKSIVEKNRIIEINDMLYKRILTNNSVRNQSTNSILTVPVVFHVIHQNGPENIADSLIFELLNQLNLRYQNSFPYYDSTGTVTGIQFCLASIDPLGNPTSGITRDTSIYTDVIWAGSYVNEIAMKDINRWNPLLYLNIWIVRSIYPFSTGLASYPSDVGQPNDGIVLLAANLIGQPTLLTHEVGHYLGLYHTFEGGTCINNNCLLDGDRVCDTPPDATIFGVCDTNSCFTEMNDTSGFNPFTGDVNDLSNYMDYTICPLSFTQGQSTRMNITLSLTRYELLQSNGCGLNPLGVIPAAIMNFSLFPNPAIDYINIQGTIAENTYFSLYNTFGQEVVNENLKANSSINQIQLNNLSIGIYFWKINSNSKMTCMGKVFINR
jgi:hypothetical protein